MRYNEEKTGVVREDLVSVINAEGIQLYQGYTKPLYLQPLYQKKHLFKNGYPFSAPDNKEVNVEYYKGLCPNAEKLHFKEMIINEHIRPPHKHIDIKDIINAIEKVVQY